LGVSCILEHPNVSITCPPARLNSPHVLSLPAPLCSRMHEVPQMNTPGAHLRDFVHMAVLWCARCHLPCSRLHETRQMSTLGAHLGGFMQMAALKCAPRRTPTSTRPTHCHCRLPMFQVARNLPNEHPECSFGGFHAYGGTLVCLPPSSPASTSPLTQCQP
jgi:hypothetical protein